MGAIFSCRSSHSSPKAKGLFYSFVARGTGPGVVVLAEYLPVKGKFSKIALECAQKLAANNHSITYTCDRQAFHFLVEDGIMYLVAGEESLEYLVVGEESLGRMIPFAFLALVQNDFREYLPGAFEANAHSLDERFRPIMQDHMFFCVVNPEHLKGLVSRLQKQVDENEGIIRLITRSRRV
ncbi:hypothetical protein MPTK1_8g09980 [Marchantia polymorpha subsp. ruderalis]|uniref:Longin domain-containing protein n=1 Tax=Marchantia polymorpha TaxID=3197 RepID=A0A2R6XMZ6_MARPO|nr:hypothetical protein MARPO_0008s0224 [Marchantia polymorpha]BBN19355.1 hypothetical protein Mp_8g09980 [Marchantia polymorpha subsp. ruderalis]|eukprot:PTQ47478.1 hypothetical protein MARPO_0008s0224 [Marchantia polymorpha]